MHHHALCFVSVADEPDAPGRPIVTDWDSDFVELEWTKPRHDGGAPVTGYIIQKKAKGSPIWQNAARVPADKTKVRPRPSNRPVNKKLSTDTNERPKIQPNAFMSMIGNIFMTCCG